MCRQRYHHLRHAPCLPACIVCNTALSPSFATPQATKEHTIAELAARLCSRGFYQQAPGTTPVSADVMYGDRLCLANLFAQTYSTASGRYEASLLRLLPYPELPEPERLPTERLRKCVPHNALQLAQNDCFVIVAAAAAVLAGVSRAAIAGVAAHRALAQVSSCGWLEAAPRFACCFILLLLLRLLRLLAWPQLPQPERLPTERLRKCVPQTGMKRFF